VTSSIVDRLAAARRNRTEVSLEGAPTDAAEAYPISAAVNAKLGEAIGGWKVGALPGIGAPMGAPMYASGFIANDGVFKLKPGRPMIPEVEIAVRLARDLPPRAAPYTRDDMLDAAAELLLGFELIERRIPRKDAPFALNLADDLGNIGYVIGPAVKDVRKLDLAALHCRFWMGADLVVDRKGGERPGDPLTPMINWANAPLDRLGGMKAGHIVTLGSLTPMKEVTAPMKLVAELEGFGRISVDLT
jgi:2-keto-4-pentenoate hydratase